MGIPSTAAHSNMLRGPGGHAYSQFEFTFTGSSAATTHATSRQHYPYHINQRAPMYQDSSSWWMSPSGLSLAAFPSESPATPYSSIGAFQFHLPHQESVASSSRAVFGANAAEAPSSPSDSVISTDTSPSPAPEYVHVICNAPLVAPKPLPYHSPTFLQFDLPDDDEDLSHPPYVCRPHKRKRENEEDDETPSFVIMKRRATDEGRGRWNTEAVHPYIHRSQLRSHAVPATGRGQFAQRHR